MASKYWTMPFAAGPGSEDCMKLGAAALRSFAPPRVTRLMQLTSHLLLSKALLLQKQGLRMRTQAPNLWRPVVETRFRRRYLVKSEFHSCSNSVVLDRVPNRTGSCRQKWGCC